MSLLYKNNNTRFFSGQAKLKNIVFKI